MKIPAFLGGADEQRSNNLSDNRLINLYPTTNNDGSIAAFYKADGLKVEGTLTGVPTGAYNASNGRAFYTSGTVLYELTVVAGVYTSTSRGTITTATNYEFSDNGIEMIMVNGTDGWLFTFSTNALAKITVLTGSFTVQAATSTDVDATLTKTSHGLIVGDIVLLTTTGSLPVNLYPNTAYYVLADSFTANSFKVGLTLTGATCTISNASPCTVTSASHGFIEGDKVRFLTTGGLPSPLTAGTVYYVISAGLTIDTFRISLTLGGAAINTTTAGSGVHSFNPAITIIQPATGTCSISSTSAVGGTCTVSFASPAILTKVTHGLVGGEIIYILDNPVPGGGTNLPGGITAGIPYYVLASGLTADTFKISLTDGGTAINTSSAGVDPQTYIVVPAGYITTATNNTFNVGDSVLFATTGALPTGLSVNTEYFVTGYQNITFELGYYAAPVYHTPTAKWLFWSGIRFYSTDTMLPAKLGQKIKFKTNGILPTILSEDVEYNFIGTGYANYYMLSVDDVIVGSSGYQHDNTTIPVTTGVGSGLHTYTFLNNFSLVATLPEIYGTRIVISGTQSGVHSYFQEGSVAFGNHTFTTGGAAFPNGAKTVSYMNGRFIACEPNTQNFYVSEVLTGRTWDETNVQTVDSNPDYVTGQIVSHNELIVFCENSGETYYDSGSTPTPFVRNLTGIFEVGCKAPYTIKEMDNSVFFLGNTKNGTGIVYRMNGLTPTRISTYSIEYAIQGMTDISDAYAFTYQKDGHHFYVLTFPTGNRTFVFDANTNLWHEREETVITHPASSGLLTAVPSGTVTIASSGVNFVLSPDGISAYAVSTSASLVYQYSRDTTTGILTALTPATLSATGVGHIIISPDGLFAYATSYGTNVIYQYSRSLTTGALTALTPSTMAMSGPYAMVISPDGLFAYITGLVSGTISQFGRSLTTGFLTALSPATIASGTQSLIISADGLSVYALSGTSGAISQFSRNATTGILTALTPSTIATAGNAYGLAISPNGDSVYSTSDVSQAIYQFSRDQVTGLLAALSPASVAGSASLRYLKVSSDGSSVYCPSYSTHLIYQFGRNEITGLLTALSPSTIATSLNPYEVEISSDGNYVYSVNGTTINQFSRAYSETLSYVEWNANKYMYFNGDHLVTDSTKILFSISSSVYKNGNNRMRIVRSFRAPPSDMKRVAHHSIQVDCEVGIGDVDLTEPVIALRWSDDAGNTWSAAIERGLGLVGDHAKTVIFRRLGSTKGLPRIYELSCDENVKITLLDCYLE